MSNPKRTSSVSTPSSGATGRRPNTSPARDSSPTSRSHSSSRVLTTNGTARTSSTKSPSGLARPNRASVRRPGSIVGSIGNINAFSGEEEAREEDARIESAALVDNLKKSLRNAELMSEDYQQQVAMVQKQMNDLLKEHVKLEDRFHESTQKVEELETRKKEDSRQVREMANLFESERMAMLRDREEAAARETELKGTVQRLRETMAGREMRFNMATDPERHRSRSGHSHSRSSSVDETAQYAPRDPAHRRSSSAARGDPNQISRIVMQKDMVIESLRLELAEAQIKVVELENMGGDRVQELEKQLLETRMTNARLLEDNESFQLLLGEKTLNGDFSRANLMHEPVASTSSGLGSLAEELETAEQENDNVRRLENEAKSLRDQNKALTLYIEKIISRVLQHDNFENILDQKTEGILGDKPPPLPAKDDVPQQSMVQRAISVVGGPRRQRPSSQIFSSTPPQDDVKPASRHPRPQSQIFNVPVNVGPTANENPETAPSIPLGRAQSISGRGRGTRHRRSDSNQSNDVGGSVATVVGNMYRGPSGGVGGSLSPSSPGSSVTRGAYFGSSPFGGNTTANSSTTSQSQGQGQSQSSSHLSGSPRKTSGLRSAPAARHGPSNSSDSALSRTSGEIDTASSSSPPRNNAGNTVYTGAVMTQHKLRPLRLVQVQENNKEGSSGAAGNAASGNSGPGAAAASGSGFFQYAAPQPRAPSAGGSDEASAAATAATKRANRASWMGWFNKGKDEPTPTRSVSEGM